MIVGPAVGPTIGGLSIGKSVACVQATYRPSADFIGYSVCISRLMKRMLAAAVLIIDRIATQNESIDRHLVLNVYNWRQLKLGHSSFE
jgi:hypothetical protein